MGRARGQDPGEERLSEIGDSGDGHGGKTRLQNGPWFLHFVTDSGRPFGDHTDKRKAIRTAKRKEAVMRNKLKAVVAGTVLLAASGAAFAGGNVSFGISIGGPAFYPAPVYVAPPPPVVYYPPAPV